MQLHILHIILKTEDTEEQFKGLQFYSIKQSELVIKGQLYGIVFQTKCHGNKQKTTCSSKAAHRHADYHNVQCSSEYLTRTDQQINCYFY